MHGGMGNDIYIWKTGHGNDTIDDDYGDNVLELGDGVDPKNIKIGRDSRDLYLLIGETGEKIRIKDWYYKNQSQLSEIRFSDGTRWSRNDVNAMTPVLYSPEEGGTQTGFSTNDILVGGAGKDFLYGNAGNDTLEGKEGDDYLDGGRGDDTYVWNLGDGNDTIYDYYDSNVLNIGGGVDPNKAVISRDGRNLYLTISETGEKLTFKNWYYSSSYQLSEIRFADGATWTKDQINAMSPVLTSPAEGGTMTGYDTDDTLVGSANADSLYGNAGNDVLEGKKGDDYLDGGYGDDTYIWNVGDGNDTLCSYSGKDVLKIGEGVDPSKVEASRDERNLYLTITETGEKLTLMNWYYHSSCRLSEIRFSDGTVWSTEDIGKLPLVASTASCAPTGASPPTRIRRLTDRKSVV